MQGECEPSGTPPPPPCEEELGFALTTTATPIDATGDICAAFSGLRLLEGNEVEPLEGGEMMVSEGVEVEGGDREQGEGGAGSEKSGDNEREDAENENVRSEKGEEEMMDSGNVNDESNGDSEKERGEGEEEQRRDSCSEEEIGVQKQRIECGTEHEEKKEEEQKVPKVKLTVPYPQRPFTPDCLTYLKSGYCAFGMSCCFNHLPLRKSGSIPLNGGCREKERLVGGGKVMNAQLYPQREGKEDCAFYMKTGRCDYGLKCCFNHPPRNPNHVQI